MSLKQLIFLVASASIVLPASAYCPAPEAKVCSAYFESDRVFSGIVVAKELVREKGDSDWYQWIRYTIEVETSFKGNAKGKVVVQTENASARWIAEVGDRRVVFSWRGDVWNLCSPIDEGANAKATIEAIKALAKETHSVVEGEVVGGVPGTKIVIAGATRSYEARVDERRRFSVAVEPGHYRIDSKGLEPFIPYSRDDVGGFDLKPGQCAQFQLSNVSVR